MTAWKDASFYTKVSILAQKVTKVWPFLDFSNDLDRHKEQLKWWDIPTAFVGINCIPLIGTING